MKWFKNKLGKVTLNYALREHAKSSFIVIALFKDWLWAEGRTLSVDDLFIDRYNPTEDELTLLSLELGVEEKYLKKIPKLLMKMKEGG